jgi:hypothetical protein
MACSILTSTSVSPARSPALGNSCSLGARVICIGALPAFTLRAALMRCALSEFRAARVRWRHFGGTNDSIAAARSIPAGFSWGHDALFFDGHLGAFSALDCFGQSPCKRPLPHLGYPHPVLGLLCIARRFLYVPTKPCHFAKRTKIAANSERTINSQTAGRSEWADGLRCPTSVPAKQGCNTVARETLGEYRLYPNVSFHLAAIPPEGPAVSREDVHQTAKLRRSGLNRPAFAISFATEGLQNDYQLG